MRSSAWQQVDSTKDTTALFAAVVGGGTKNDTLAQWSVDSRCGWKPVSEFEKIQLDHDRQAGPESVYLSQPEPRIIPLARQSSLSALTALYIGSHNVMDSLKVFETF